MTRRLLSAHSRYREQLEALAGTDVFLGAVAEAFERWGHPETRVSTRLYERFEPDAEPYATCVLATADQPQRIVRLDAFREGRPAPDPGVVDVAAGGAGRLRVAWFPDDPALPTLPAAVAGPGRRTVVRYHPGRRCTIRVDDDGRTRYAKVYANWHGERIHADGLELWHAASRGELGFRVAEPERFEPELHAVWHGSVRGEPVKDRLGGPDGKELAWRVGRAAGTLSRAGLRPRARRNRGDELAAAARRCAELERRVPELGLPASRLLERLKRAYAACPVSKPRPVHGALHASQWLENGVGLALLDYDSLALGDPELDAATFLADVDVQNRERVPVDRLNSAFLAGYEETGDPLDPRLLAAYRANRRLEKALRVARALRTDGDAKAGRRLRGALDCLEPVSK
jgi:hypothetical protein